MREGYRAKEDNHQQSGISIRNRKLHHPNITTSAETTPTVPGTDSCAEHLDMP